MQRVPAPWWKPFPVTLLLVFAFTFGVAAERYGWLKLLGHSGSSDLGPEFDSVAETWQLIHDYYPDRQAVDPNKLSQAAIDGMLGVLGDAGHTALLTPQDYADQEKSLDGSMEGIGARLTLRSHKPAVASVVPKSPAQKAGLQPGDVFLQVDGKDVADRTPEQIASMVRGPAGTKVTVQLARQGEKDPLEFTITRAKIEVPLVSWHMLPGTTVAHLAIEEFGDKVQQQVREAVDEAREKGARGLIVDVRGNPGGLRDQAVSVTSEFLKGGDVMLEQDSRGQQKKVPVKPGGTATDIPLVVLVDEGTVSAAEIFAAAIQDHERGKVVGTKTFGTGTILMTFRLQDGSAVNMAVARWLTPKGRSLWHVGLQPDVEVSLPRGGTILRPEEELGLDADHLAKSKDTQLLKATELLREKLPAE
jgi:carboxyl-terminal processing protease